MKHKGGAGEIVLLNTREPGEIVQKISKGPSEIVIKFLKGIRLNRTSFQKVQGEIVRKIFKGKKI